MGGERLTVLEENADPREIILGAKLMQELALASA
jgi:hypothetical protein